MRRLRRACRSIYPPWLDGRETESPLFIGWNPPESHETSLDRLVLEIVRMKIFAVGVRLPDFEHRIRHAVAIAIEDAPFNLHSLARDTLPGDVVAVQPRATDP